MDELIGFKQKVRNLQYEDFLSLSLDIFRFQAENNEIYRQYINELGIEASSVAKMSDIPFLPISFFKVFPVKTLKWKAETHFKSSGTTGMTRSVHEVEDLTFYLDHSEQIFSEFLGNPNEWVIYALLPSYQEQKHSSLIAMVDHLMTKAIDKKYYQDDFAGLENAIKQQLDSGRRVLLFGVGYALLDFSHFTNSRLDGLVVVETGGMKGRRKEMIKEEFYKELSAGLGDIEINSEYGMTELLSQAYQVDGLYQCPSTMAVLIRELNDPFSYVSDNKTGAINVIDLANVHSCSFIETSDLGRMNSKGQFEVLGRMDNADIRGCNLMIA